MQRRDILKTLLLLGVTTSSPLVNAIEAGLSDRKLNAVEFSDSQRQAVQILAEMIIPRTDTPGAIEASVPSFIEYMFVNWYHDTERNVFLKGLQALDDYCLREERSTFIRASKTNQKSALLEQEMAANQYVSSSRPVNPGFVYEDPQTPFFTKLRDLVVIGYFTSEVGSKQVSKYLPVPGYFDGEHEVEHSGHHWSH